MDARSSWGVGRVFLIPSGIKKGIAPEREISAGIFYEPFSMAFGICFLVPK